LIGLKLDHATGCLSTRTFHRYAARLILHRDPNQAVIVPTVVGVADVISGSSQVANAASLMGLSGRRTLIRIVQPATKVR